VRFLTRRSHPAPDAAPSGPESATELDPVAVFQADGVIEGWIVRHEGRLSEALNGGQPLRTQLANADGTPGDWVQFHTDDVLAFAAPPRPEPSPRRVGVEAIGCRLGAAPG